MLWRGSKNPAAGHQILSKINGKLNNPNVTGSQARDE